MSSLGVTESNILDAFSKISVGGVADWQRAGISLGRQRALVAAGQLVPIRRGAYATKGILARVAEDPCLRHALDVAAVRALRGRAGVASHQSAATMHGLRLLTAPSEGMVTLTVPQGSARAVTADPVASARLSCPKNTSPSSTGYPSRQQGEQSSTSRALPRSWRVS